MNKTQLLDIIQEKLGEGATKKCAAAALSAVLTAIGDAAKKGEKIQLIGFGTFAMKTRPARVCRNPRTNAEVKVPASSTLSFKPASVFKTVVKKSCKKSCKKK